MAVVQNLSGPSALYKVVSKPGEPGEKRWNVSPLDIVARPCHTLTMPVKEAVVRARVDEKLKKDSETILRKLGLSPAEAIRMFFTQITLRQGLPFSVSLQQSENDDLLLPRAKRQAAINSLYDD